MSNSILRRLWLNTNPDHDALVIALLLITGLVLVGAAVYHRAEGLGRFNSVYFAMISISTIGYGDIVPHTVAGKIVTMVYSITGVPLFIYTAGLFVERRIKSVVDTYITQQQQKIQEIEWDIDDLEQDIEKITHPDPSSTPSSQQQRPFPRWKRLIARK